MYFGKLVRNIRLDKGLTQKQLGLAMGFNEKSADVRIAQYESGARKPRKAVRGKLAEVLGEPIEMLDIPQLENSAQILFALVYNQDIAIYEGFLEQTQTCLQKREELDRGEISIAKYEAWRIQFAIDVLDALKESFKEKHQYVNIENLEKRLKQLSQTK